MVPVQEWSLRVEDRLRGTVTVTQDDMELALAWDEVEFALGELRFTGTLGLELKFLDGDLVAIPFEGHMEGAVAGMELAGTGGTIARWG